MWEVVNTCAAPYDDFLEEIKKAVETVCPDMAEEYGMRVISEMNWHPFYMKRRASFSDALTMAKIFLKPKKSDFLLWYHSPLKEA